MRKIARQLLEVIIYDNDIVNRLNPLNETKLKPWIDKVEQALIDSKVEPSIFTEEIIDMFAAGDADEMEAFVKEHPTLAEVHKLLNDFFDNPNVTGISMSVLAELTAAHKYGGEEPDRTTFIDGFLSAIGLIMIKWNGDNLRQVIDFTGKSLNFYEWFKSWEEYEAYVHAHGNILKLFDEEGNHYEVPVGAWIIKSPDGYNVPSVAKYVSKYKRFKVKLCLFHDASVQKEMEIEAEGAVQACKTAGKKAGNEWYAYEAEIIN